MNDRRPKIVAVSGLSSNTGKTTLACELIKRLPGTPASGMQHASGVRTEWEAIKITRGHYRSCGKDPNGCCVSDLLRDEPQPPLNFAVTRVGRQLALGWDPPSTGTAVTSYVLVVTGDIVVDLPLLTRSIGGAVPPGTYTFAVRSVNRCGQGTTTAPQTVTVP